MTDSKNTIIAIVLSAIVLIGWQYFVGMPQLEKQKQEQAQQQAAQKAAGQPGQAAPPPAATAPAAQPGAAPAPGQVPGQTAAPPAAAATTRAAALAATPRVPIETGSIAGLDRPQGRPHRRHRAGQVPRNRRSEVAADRAALAVGQPGAVLCRVRLDRQPPAPTSKLPTSDTVWKQAGSGALSVGHPVTLTYDNGEGLQFRRTITVDDKYLFTIKDEVVNKSGKPGHAVSLRADLAPRHAADARLLYPA